MLRKLMNRIMGILTWWKSPKKDLKAEWSLQDIPAEFVSNNMKPITTSDSSYTTEHKAEIGRRVKEFMNTPEAKRLRSEMTVQAAEEMLIPISEKMQNPDLTTPQRMMLGIALEECVATLKRHEKILQWMML